MMTNGVIDIGSQLYIPQEGEYTIYGESEDFSYYIVYPDEYIEKKTLIYGEPDNTVNNYWAVRFNSGKVTEVWTAKFPLSEEDLLPYTRDEQLEKVKYRGGIYSEELIGYYNVINDSSID